MTARFEVICEIEPATTPDLKKVRHQIGLLSPIASAFLIPDNHIGRATVSSVAVAHEVQAMERPPICCTSWATATLETVARPMWLSGMRKVVATGLRTPIW